MALVKASLNGCEIKNVLCFAMAMAVDDSVRISQNLLAKITNVVYAQQNNLKVDWDDDVVSCG